MLLPFLCPAMLPQQNCQAGATHLCKGYPCNGVLPLAVKLPLTGKPSPAPELCWRQVAAVAALLLMCTPCTWGVAAAIDWQEKRSTRCALVHSNEGCVRNDMLLLAAGKIKEEPRDGDLLLRLICWASLLRLD